VVAAIAAVFLAAKDFKSHDDKSVSQPVSAPAKTASNRACQIFTSAEAQDLLDSSVKAGQNLVSTASPDLNISTCTYTQSGVANRNSASLLVRVPTTDKGITSNNNEFGPLKPTTVQDVSGYGDSAYWDAEHGQLNILKNNNWYILSFGAAVPSSRSLEQTRQMADLLIDKL
jgi:hypothetical protein